MEVIRDITTSADGTAVAWYDFGGKGPDVLLGHATGFTGQMWTPVVEVLRSHLRCVAYDVRAHGASDRPQGPANIAFAWERFADDAAAVLAAAALEQPLGIGHSSGGATQLLLEQRRPQTFRSLFLYEPVIFANDPPIGPAPDRELALRARKRRSTFPSREAALENFAMKGPFTKLRQDALHAYIDHGFSVSVDGTLTLRCRPDDEAEVYVMASAHGGYVELPKVTCPVTIGHGQTSTSFSTADMQSVVDRLPRATLLQFEGLGHFGPLEDPERFAAAVLRAFQLA